MLEFLFNNKPLLKSILTDRMVKGVHTFDKY